MFQRLKQHLQQSFYGSSGASPNQNGSANASANASPSVSARRARTSLSPNGDHSELASDSGSSAGASPLHTWYFRPFGQSGGEASATIELLCAQQIALDVVGHAFLAFEVPAPTWCDQCADFIWGIYRASQRCKYCNFTCHSRCMRNVDFVCPGNPQLILTPSSSAVFSPESASAPASTAVPESAPTPAPAPVPHTRVGEAVLRPNSTQLTTVFDAHFDEDSLKSPLGLIENVVPFSGTNSSSDVSCTSVSVSECDSLNRVRSQSESTTTNHEDEAGRFLLSSPSGDSSDDSIESASPPPSAVGHVPAYAFTSLDKWSMRRFRIRVNEVQTASTNTKVDADAEDEHASDWLNDVTVPDPVKMYHADCGTVGPLAKGQSIDGCNLSLPTCLTRCDYALLSDEPPESKLQNGNDSLHAPVDPCPLSSMNTLNDYHEAELEWFLEAQKTATLDRCLSVFAQNEVGFAAQSVPDEANLGASTTNTQQQQLLTLNGAIRVYINLIRPIKMALKARPLTIYDLLPSAVNNALESEQLETFLLPRGTTRLLYISSVTTTAQLICCLLRKFHIRDNPRKFALYEHTIESEHDVTIRKFADHERPLLTCLRWTFDATLDREAFSGLLAKKRIVLQENESGDIDWEAFSAPELNNFLLILQREEDDRLREIRHKYRLIKREFQRVLKENASQQRAADDGDMLCRAE